MEFALLQERYGKEPSERLPRWKVEYETSHRITLYDRDFLGLEWGAINLQKPTNLTAYCLLDRNYEYKLYDIVAKGYNPYSRFVPVNHKLLPDADFLPTTKRQS